jgi:prolyl-tRNA synthetase
MATGRLSAILLDAGGVLIFPSADLMLPPLRARGMFPDAAALERAHYRAMVGQDTAAAPPARDTWWRDYLLSYLAACGAAADGREALAAEITRAITGPHWTHVGTGVMDGLRALASLGIPLGVVSNSDGTVQAELCRLGICYAPDGPEPPLAAVPVGVVVDSAVAGVAKPDPAIFRIALASLGVPADGAVLHVGDSLRYDVAGAVAAGLQPVHMDPFGFCPAPAGHPHIRSLADLTELISARRLPSAEDRLRAFNEHRRKRESQNMRWSTMHIPTLRDDPADAGAPSHRLLLRAGYIRQLMAGHYSLLPLGQRVRLKVIGIIREEMNRIGAQEILMPVMHPAEPWQRSGRWELMGDEMFRLKDRRGADLALGMTHEEIIATLATELESYRELPQLWYQFQTKLRDEPRPKAGLMRTREFTMKDSYSFDLGPAGLDTSFRLHREAYIKAFERLAIPAIPVEASSGTMGGSDSTEFVCPSPSGEDLIVLCPDCGYAANVEIARSRLAAVQDGEGLPAPEPFPTPGVRTIEDLATGYDAPADRQVKTLVYFLDGVLTLVLLRGDHALHEQKLVDATGATSIRAAQPEEIREALGALPGSLGAVGVTDHPVIADEALRGRRGMYTGANVDDTHLRGVDVERDITVGTWASLREAAAGEPCINCGHGLEIERGIEVGHIFKLGYKYTEAMDIRVSGPDGKPVRPIMGSYGIGVERAMATIVEVHYDDKGIIWPAAVAPFEVVVVIAQQDDPAVAAAGERVYQALLDAGVEAIVDDRQVRAGVKFSDAELVGIPFRVTVGKRGLSSGAAELTERATGNTVQVPLDDLPHHVREAVAKAIASNR